MHGHRRLAQRVKIADDLFVAHVLAHIVALAVNHLFRDAKHLLIDMDETLRELEEALIKGPTAHAARYVTMLRKDVENDVNYIMLKVNGRITDSVNGFQV